MKLRYATKLEKMWHKSTKTKRMHTWFGKSYVELTNEAKKYRLLLVGKYKPELEFYPPKMK